MKKIIFILLFMTLVTRAYGQALVSVASVASVKAAYIFHFINFTEWNDNLNNYYVCVADDENLKEALEISLKGKIINNRHIVVSNEAPTCHVLISDQPEFGPNTLTIGSLDKGALFEFRVVNKKLKFFANLEKIRTTKLKISSQLLKLALPENS